MSARQAEAAAILAMEPVIAKRVCPGFLAISPLSTPIRIATEGLTEAEARARFKVARERWAELRRLP